VYEWFPFRRIGKRVDLKTVSFRSQIERETENRGLAVSLSRHYVAGEDNKAHWSGWRPAKLSSDAAQCSKANSEMVNN
jgi:hypothetical protein